MRIVSTWYAYTKVEAINVLPFDKAMFVANSLRFHRRQTGLSQAELGRLLGYNDDSAVRKHERFQAMPPFLVALGYEIIFQIPVSELFPGISETVALGIEARLAQFADAVRQVSDATQSASTAKRKAGWLEDRLRSNVVSH